MFYFNVSINYHFNYSITQSKSYKQVKEDISKEIQSNVGNFIKTIGIFKNLMVIALLFILVKAVIYRSRWLSDDRYDNIYITFTVRDLDERRVEKGKSGILPLNYDEENRYLTSMSARMINKEKRKLAFGLVLFIISLFNAAFYLFCDYGLYAVLSLVSRHFSLATKAPIPPHAKLNVVGEGPMSDMYRSIVGMFDPLAESNIKVDVSPCVPHPSEPDWNIYIQIGIIYIVCLILTISEAYGLRTRHLIMNCYFPKRERRRAIWLYNHILKLRGGLLENARTSIKKRHKGEVDQDHISLKGRLAASFPILERLFKCLGWEVKSCLYCGREGKPDDYLNFVHCSYFDCDAVYCVECYADLDNICAVCTNAVEINGSEASEEEDSSVDERQQLTKLAQKAARYKRIANIQKKHRKRMVDLRARLEIPSGSIKKNNIKSTGQDFKHGISKHSSIMRRGRTNANSLKRKLIKNKNENSNALQYLIMDKHSKDSSPESDTSFCSSVDTDDLDFVYQYETDLNICMATPSSDSKSAENTCVNRQKDLDLVTEDIFSATGSDTDSLDSDSESHLMEPHSLVICRS